MIVSKTFLLAPLSLSTIALAAGPSLSRQQPAADLVSIDIAVVYKCDNGDTLAATFPKYPSTGAATLSIQGRKIVLQTAMSADGGRYLASSGLTEGKVLEWWIKGAAATLSEGPLGQGDNGSKTLIARCRVIDDRR